MDFLHCVVGGSRTEGAADGQLARRDQLQVVFLGVVDADIVSEQSARFSGLFFASYVVELGVGGGVEEKLGRWSGAGGLRSRLAVGFEGGC